LQVKALLVYMLKCAVDGNRTLQVRLLFVSVRFVCKQDATGVYRYWENREEITDFLHRENIVVCFCFT
jgi:hypothetical protein